MPHKHADNMRLFAEDAAETAEPWLRWQFNDADCGWQDCEAIPRWRVKTGYRRKPQSRVIDWSKVGKDVPVRVWDFEDKGRIAFLESFDPAQQFWHKIKGGVRFKCASLETGIWVANVDGVNPWPPGCIVEVQFVGRVRDSGNGGIWDWRLGDNDSYIIASRCVGLAEGYSYE
jgi:hypothetical protein